jgi:hypothetical protein
MQANTEAINAYKDYCFRGNDHSQAAFEAWMDCWNMVVAPLRYRVSYLEAEMDKLSDMGMSHTPRVAALEGVIGDVLSSNSSVVDTAMKHRMRRLMGV